MQIWDRFPLVWSNIELYSDLEIKKNKGKQRLDIQYEVEGQQKIFNLLFIDIEIKWTSNKHGQPTSG